MIEQFEVSPSRLMVIYIVFVHVFTIVCVMSFDLSMLLIASTTLILLISLAITLKQWSAKGHFFIKYESAFKCWSVSSDSNHWQRFEHLNVAYLNDSLVWIILSSPGKRSRAKIIGVDSLSNERFLQLRRCIICPGIFNQRFK
ncbi:MAG: protein YgfX [Gammaproteobacteria bacterium]